MDAKLMAVIDGHLAAARSAGTLEEARAAYETAIAAILQSYHAALTIVHVGLANKNEAPKNEPLAEADEGTRH